MDIHTATEQAYKNGYAAAEREYKLQLTRMGETIQELSDQLNDLAERKNDLERLKEALPYLTECPLCDGDLTQRRDTMRTLRSGDFMQWDLTKDQIEMRKKRALIRLWKQIKDYVTVIEDTRTIAGRRILTAEITILDNKRHK